MLTYGPSQPSRPPVLETALLDVCEQLQDESRSVELVLKEAFDPLDRGLGLRGAGDSFGEFAVSDIFGLDNRTDHRDQEIALVFVVLGE